MKNYLKALLECEENNQSYNLLCEYISLKKTDLINSYCDGGINLPSFVLLKKLKANYAHLVVSDAELNSLFENVIKCSKIFYARTLKILVIKDIKFENIFIQQVQPIGQQLVNLLINIKLRINLVKLKQSKPSQKIHPILAQASMLANPIRKIFISLLYKMSLFQATNYKYVPYIYMTGLSFLLPILLIIEHYLIDDISIETSYINIVFCMSLLISAILAYPVKRFGKIDIHGQDIVAYKYKVFFNNRLNKKMYQLFTPKNLNIARHKINQGIE